MVPEASLLLALLGALSADAASPTPSTRREAVVLRTVENMYSAPSFEADVVSQAFLGQLVAVHETKGGFANIETPDRYRGWAPLHALKPYSSPRAPRYAAKGRVGRVTSLSALVYREPDVTSHRPKAQAPLGARLEIVEEAKDDGRWHRVRLPAGDEGFVQRGDLVLGEASEAPLRRTPSELVATARRMLGVPYLWGGMTPLGIDCSGFVGLVYRLHGRILPRDTDLQFDDPESVPVDEADLAPGDLVFFGKKAITHVGLYLAEGRFISATTYQVPVVREDHLDDPYWREIYKGARRPR